MPSYSNGYIPDSLLVTFKTGYTAGEGNWAHKLSPSTYRKHVALVALAKEHTGRDLTIGNGWGAYRPYDSQLYARSKYGMGAAYPGTSSHGGFWEGQQTLAMDYDNWGWVYGWDRDAFYRDVRTVGLTPGMIHPSRGNGYPDEPWHVIDTDPWAPLPAGGKNAAVINESEEDDMDTAGGFYFGNNDDRKNGLVRYYSRARKASREVNSDELAVMRAFATGPVNQAGRVDPVPFEIYYGSANWYNKLVALGTY